MAVSRTTPLSIAAARVARLASCAALLFFALLISIGSTSAQTQANRPVARLITGTPRTSRHIPVNYSHPTARRNSAIATITTGAMTTTGDEQRTFEMINARRRASDLEPLVLDAELCRMARLHSQRMAGESFFAHAGADGLEAPERARALGITGWRALGENIAYNQGFDDPAAFAVERWMVSTKHRENITSRTFTHTGLGVARAADGRIFFTQVFMTR